MKIDTVSLQELLRKHNTTAYKIMDGIIQIRNNGDGMYHYFSSELNELPMTSLHNIFVEED